MEISNKIFFPGFIRTCLGEQEDGAVFIRYQEQKDERTASVEQNAMYYYGNDYISYSVKIPKPLAKKIDGIIIIKKTSKNRYTVMAAIGNNVESFCAEKIDQIKSRIDQMRSVNYQLMKEAGII